jgi:hypothetical protein
MIKYLKNKVNWKRLFLTLSILTVLLIMSKSDPFTILFLLCSIILMVLLITHNKYLEEKMRTKKFETIKDIRKSKLKKIKRRKWLK